MRGEKSDVEFFKQFPKVIPSFYQCSLTSTSENLEDVFKNAKNKLEKYNYEIISLIFIDEMGIADGSPNNPLKVLHSQLDENSWEKDEKKKIAFIGISNWTLDASKMNRTINNVVEEPKLDYLEVTAEGIIKAIKPNFEHGEFKIIIKAVCEAYLFYILKQVKCNKEDFHGFRDFYYLIKYIIYNISEDYNNNINNSFYLFPENNINNSYLNPDDDIHINIIDNNNYLEPVIKGIYRNFGGFKDSEKKYLDSLKDKLSINNNLYRNYNVMDRIKDNIESEIESRYLLLITDYDALNILILKYILQGKKFEIISEENINKFENKNNAIINILLQIEILMKNEIILILKNLDILYPSLYELFNKNFSEYYEGGNKFVQISYENQYSLNQVNEKFRIIVLVNEEKLDVEEKPFLNRFEKQIFSIKTILNQEK